LEGTWTLGSHPRFIGFVSYHDDSIAPERGSGERARFVAKMRNMAVVEAVGKYPEATDILMIDSYYVSQVGAILRLIDDYLSMRHDCVLGASTWFLDSREFPAKYRFWDSWVTPSATNESCLTSGISRAESVGGCYLFPRMALNNGASYSLPPGVVGSEQVYFCRSSRLPIYLDFNVKLLHPPPEGWDNDRGPITRVLRAFRRKTRPRRFLPLPKHMDGFKWYFPYYNRTFDSYHEEWLRKLAIGRGGDYFFDVGANVGGWSLRASRKFRSVFAFEPHPKSGTILRRNVEKNHVNARIFPCALGEKNDTTRFFEYSDAGNASLFPSTTLRREEPKRSFEVQIRKLDDFHLPCSKDSLVKIDTEGAEVSVLHGMKQMIEAHHPRLIVETHSEENLRECTRLLREHGYDIREIWIPGQSYLLGDYTHEP